MEITVKQAVDRLTAELKKDPSLFIAWQANIAMAVYDTFDGNQGHELSDNGIHEICNEGAIRFLNMLCEDRPNDSAESDRS